MKHYVLAAVGLIVLVVVVGLIAFGVWYAVTDEADRDETLDDLGIRSSEDTLEGSGFVEATMVDIASEHGGRVATVRVAAGEPVESGAVLVELSDDALLAQRRQAEASLAAAEAQLAGLQAGARPQQLRRAELAVSRARAAAEGAQGDWQEATRALADRKAPTAKVSAAQAELDAATERLRGAEALFAAAGDRRTQLEGTAAGAPAAAGGEAVADAVAGWWDAWAARESARIAAGAAEAQLESAQRQLDDPVTLQMAADAAQAEHEVAQAGLALAEANRDLAEDGADALDVEMAEAAVEQARARLNGVDAKLELLRLRSPMDGTIIDVPVSVGELVVPGKVLVRVGQLDPVTLTIYAPETEMDRLDVGLTAEVEIDAVDDEVFEGEVVTIASEAEFTPKNVQTKDERANLVYAVKIVIPNPNDLLKPGMPANATVELD